MLSRFFGFGLGLASPASRFRWLRAFWEIVGLFINFYRMPKGEAKAGKLARKADRDQTLQAAKNNGSRMTRKRTGLLSPFR